MSPVYDDRQTHEAATTSAAAFGELAQWVGNAVQMQGFVVGLADRLASAETNPARREYLETVALMLRKRDYAAAAAFIDAEVF